MDINQDTSVIKVKPGMRIAVKLNMNYDDNFIWKNIEKPNGLRLESCYIELDSIQYWIYEIRDNCIPGDLIFIYTNKRRDTLINIRIFKIVV